LLKEKKKLYFFAGFDAILLQLDEAISIVSTVRSSRFIAALKTQAVDWARSLRVFSSTMNLLMNCQRNFVYVNNVFSVGNISAQLPTETKDFAAVKGKWTMMSEKN
jgi:dynein heavy chain